MPQIGLQVVFSCWRESNRALGSNDETTPHATERTFILARIARELRTQAALCRVAVALECVRWQRRRDIDGEQEYDGGRTDTLSLAISGRQRAHELGRGKANVGQGRLWSRHRAAADSRFY